MKKLLTIIIISAILPLTAVGQLSGYLRTKKPIKTENGYKVKPRMLYQFGEASGVNDTYKHVHQVIKRRKVPLIDGHNYLSLLVQHFGKMNDEIIIYAKPYPYNIYNDIYLVVDLDAALASGEVTLK